MRRTPAAALLGAGCLTLILSGSSQAIPAYTITPSACVKPGTSVVLSGPRIAGDTREPPTYVAPQSVTASGVVVSGGDELDLTVTHPTDASYAIAFAIPRAVRYRGKPITQYLVEGLDGQTIGVDVPVGVITPVRLPATGPGTIDFIHAFAFGSARTIYAHILRAGRSMQTVVLKPTARTGRANTSACGEFTAGPVPFVHRPKTGSYRVVFDTRRRYRNDSTGPTATAAFRVR